LDVFQTPSLDHGFLESVLDDDDGGSDVPLVIAGVPRGIA
jgi:hypothetical protein